MSQYTLSYTGEEVNNLLTTVSENSSAWDSISQSTDYIVDQGTSGYWHYRKWNSGWADAYYLGESASHTTQYVSGNIYYASIGSISFPFTFTDIPRATAHWIANGYSCYVTLDSFDTNGIGYVYLNRGNNATTTGKLCIVLGGWWK